jgi:hypothetical protein
MVASELRIGEEVRDQVGRHPGPSVGHHDLDPVAVHPGGDADAGPP